MFERTEVRFGIKPAWLAADTAYGSAPTLHWLVQNLRRLAKLATRRRLPPRVQNSVSLLDLA